MSLKETLGWAKKKVKGMKTSMQEYHKEAPVRRKAELERLHGEYAILKQKEKITRTKANIQKLRSSSSSNGGDISLNMGASSMFSNYGGRKDKKRKDEFGGF